MSDHPPTTAADAPPANPAPSKRPRTILGRLSKAVREQNWFAVALELVIVVFGVLIAFQVTSWGQSRTDRAREQVYLRQLAADLAETERIMADREARVDAGIHYGLPRVLNAYGAAERPPRDSLAAWLTQIWYIPAPRPVLGTAEALTASGNLQTVRNDSLRAAILRYLDESRETIIDQERFMPRARANQYWLNNRINITGLHDEFYDTREHDLLGRLDWDTTGAATSPDWGAPFPPDLDGLLDDEEAFERIFHLFVDVENLAEARRVFAVGAAALRAQVEAELNR